VTRAASASKLYMSTKACLRLRSILNSPFSPLFTFFPPVVAFVRSVLDMNTLETAKDKGYNNDKRKTYFINTTSPFFLFRFVNPLPCSHYSVMVVSRVGLRTRPFLVSPSSPAVAQARGGKSPTSRASGAPAASGEGGKKEEEEEKVHEAGGGDGDDAARRACSSLPPGLVEGFGCPPPLLHRGASVLVVVRVEAQGEEGEKVQNDGGWIS